VRVSPGQTAVSNTTRDGSDDGGMGGRIAATDTWVFGAEAIVRDGRGKGHACRGEIIMTGQVRAFKTSEIAGQIQNWQPEQTFPLENKSGGRAFLVPWTSGNFPASEKARFWRDDVERETDNDGGASLMLIHVAWGCGQKSNTEFRRGTPASQDANRPGFGFRD